jgi:hypothetical protein
MKKIWRKGLTFARILVVFTILMSVISRLSEYCSASSGKLIPSFESLPIVIRSGPANSISQLFRKVEVAERKWPSPITSVKLRGIGGSTTTESGMGLTPQKKPH